MKPDASSEPPGSTFLLLEEGWKVARNLKDWEVPALEDLREELPSYGISRLYSKGGMGAVYQGQHLTLERVVAIKIMAPALDDDPAFAKRFLAEARAMAGLCHPGIVTVHDAGETPGGLLYYVMEFVEGADLSEILAAEGKLPLPRALSIVRQVGAALMAAHAAGIIHRDIKPSNVIVDPQGTAKVTDFGLARSAHLDDTDGAGVVMGTEEYMPPEARLEGFEGDARTDVYALGVMGFRMVTGRMPSSEKDTVPVAETALGRILKRAMAPKPEARYQTVAAMMTDLDHLADQAARRIRQSRRGVTAAVALVALTGVWSLRPDPPEKNGSLPERQLAEWIAAAPLPAESTGRSFPTGRWAGVRADQAQFPGLTEEPGGWQRLPGNTILRPIKARGMNWGVRVTFRGHHHSHPPGLILRETGGKNYNACLVEGSRLFFSRYDPEATPSSTRLGELRLLRPVLPDQPYTLECFIIGRRLVCRAGTDILSLTLTDPQVPGGMALHTAGQDGFRDLQFINLDGMPEAQAEQLALGHPSKSKIPPPAAAAPAWTTVPLSPYLKAGVEIQEKDGWFRLPGRKILQLHPALVTDGGLRVTFQGRNEGPSPELNLRAGSDGNYNLFRTSTAMVVQQYLPGAPEGQRYRTLRTMPLPRLGYGQPYTLELVAIGNRLRAQCGEVSCEVPLPALESGTLSLYGPGMDGFRDACVIVCDGLTNAAARRAAGWPEVP